MYMLSRDQMEPRGSRIELSYDLSLAAKHVLFYVI